MVAALLSCAKAIYETHEREHVTAEGRGKASTLAGEEMLPILCYIIAHGEVRLPKRPPSQTALVDRFGRLTKVANDLRR